MKIIPAIDLIAGQTVRLEQGQYNNKLTYNINPIDAAKKWKAIGSKFLHIIDLDGAREGVPKNLDIVKNIINKIDIKIQLGGGFRKYEDIKKVLDFGVNRVIVGSRALEDLYFAETIFKEFNNKVIFSIDAKDFQPKIHGWEKSLDYDVFDLIEKFKSFGVQEIIFTDIKKDGMLSGPSIDVLKTILLKTKIKIISAGGIKTVQDVLALKQIENLGISGVIIGRALYEGTIDLKEAISVS